MKDFLNKLLVSTLTALAIVGTPVQALADAVIFSGNDVKTLKSNIDLNGNAKILSGSVDPTSSATSAPIGSIYLNTVNGNNYKKQDAGSSTNWVKLASGADAGINYITNPGAEQNTTSWTTYADLAQNTPLDATGGAPSSTWTRVTSTPLRGVGAFLWTRTAANRQGEGVSTPFAIDQADLGKSLEARFDFKIVSGTFFAADGITAPLNDGTTTVNAGMSDLEVFVYDVTNSVLIPVSPQVLTCTSSVACSFKGTFQTPVNSTSFRFALHTSRSTAVAFTSQFDNFYVGPIVSSSVSPVTDWTSYVPTFGGIGTATNISYYYRRVGDSVEISGFHTVGSLSANPATITLPPGMTIDSSKVSGNVSGNAQVVGTLLYNAVSTTVFNWAVLATPGNTYLQVGMQNSASQAALTPANGSTIFSTAGRDVTMFARVPIAGWSSSVQMSNDDDSRSVIAKYIGAGGSNFSLTGGTSPLRFDSVEYDSHSAVTTGSGWKFTAPKSAMYEFTWNLYSPSGGSSDIYAYKNGSSTTQIVGLVTGATAQNKTTCSFYLKAGDYIQFIPQSNITISDNSSYNYITVKSTSKSSTIAASESISASYYFASSTGVTSNAAIAWDTKEWDDHSAVSGGRFSAPLPGKYLVTGTFQEGSGSVNLSVYKNGSRYRYLAITSASSERTYSQIVPCLAGDILDVRVDGNVTVSGGATASSFQITRLGN